MAKIRVYQPKEEHVEEVKQIIDAEEQNPSTEQIQTLYISVLATEDMEIPDAFTEEDILIDSVEGMVNASSNKIRNLGPYDIIEVINKGKRKQILLLADDEYEIIED
ncbi:hypothetical protein [Bacillus sp. 165]|uniref:hypothetical protein n=1 Tax=Bacillus sp. 165 TaxID=1529117 RepID=UPI001AD95FF5|nr:hypothetical protein [Bacillus sp. 165]MBO9129217.1 hypothetical protein [Bacillus sp. 165]